MNTSGSDGHLMQDNELDANSKSSEILTRQESFDSTVVVEYGCKAGVLSKMNNFGRALKKCFIKSRSSRNLTKTSNNSLEDDADSNLSFLYNTSIDDFRTVTECQQPIRFIVPNEPPRYSSHAPEAVKDAHKPSGLSNENDPVENVPEREPELQQKQLMQDLIEDQIEIICCSDSQCQSRGTSVQVQVEENNRLDGNDCSQLDLSLPMKAIDSKTLISKNPGRLVNEKSTSTDEPNKALKTPQVKKPKKVINIFRERQAELHRFRVDVEKKRLELLELKLTREREEIMHERVKFERDLEYKELVIKQIKEESHV